MGHEDERRAVAAGEPEEELPYRLRARGVEVARRLVGEHEARIIDEGPGYGRPLALASREGSGQVIEPIAEAHVREEGPRPLIGLGLLFAPHVRRQGYVLEGAEILKQVMELEDETYRPCAVGGELPLREELEMEAPYAEAPPARLIESSEHGQGGCSCRSRSRP